jgi:hypothetical protein
MYSEEEWQMQTALNIVSSMTVDEFQTQLEKHKIEDVPIEVSDRDRYGKVQIKSYYEFYQSILFVPDKNDNLQPAGMSSTNKDYI